MIHNIYKKEQIKERHRNRYEFNNEYLKYFDNSKLKIVAKTANNEIRAIEHFQHPWFIGTLYHAEFLSRPLRTHPLFDDFILASINNKIK